ncbi:MAG: repeat containing protein, partial [Verrucomicrobiales bacterium]|nr:repeat containing protein [Verrucomicrobiales bacterium]
NGNGSAITTQLLKITTGRTNTPPVAPASLTTSNTPIGINLIWNGGNDGQTPAPGLTYNLRIGTNAGGAQILQPQANLATGWRRLPQRGNGQNALTAKLTGLVKGATYFWSVQSIDAAFAGSPFSSEGTFVFAQPPVSTSAASGIGSTFASLNGAVNSIGLDTGVFFEWGTTAGFGNTTPAQLIGNGVNTANINGVLPLLQPGGTYFYRMVATNAYGTNYGSTLTFTTALNAPPTLSDLTNRSTAVNSPTTAIPFTIGDLETAAANLVVTAMSGNTNLVPQANLVLGGSGTNRTLTITPATDQSGIVTIVLTVSDGVSTTPGGFTLSIGQIPGDTNNDRRVDLNELNTVIQYYRQLLLP